MGRRLVAIGCAVVALVAAAGVAHAAVTGSRTALTGGNSAYAWWDAETWSFSLTAKKVTTGTSCVDSVFDWRLYPGEPHTHHDARIVRNCRAGYTYGFSAVEPAPGAGWMYIGDGDKVGGCYLLNPTANYTTGSNVNGGGTRTSGCYPTSVPQLLQVQANATGLCAKTRIYRPDGTYTTYSGGLRNECDG